MTRQAFEQAIIAMQDEMYHVASAILYRPCDREDAVQECVCKALAKRDTLRDDQALHAWVMRILVNECYAALRRSRRELAVDELPEPEPQPDPGVNVDVFQAVFSLKRELRLPVVMCYVHDMTVAQAAQALRVPQGTVKSRLWRARRKLRLILDEEAQK